jgi:hypothetical protein
MKFKFCGNIDCPEWLIAEIIFLTKISTIKLRIICNNLVTSILTNAVQQTSIKKSLEEMNFTDEECNIIISVLEFIIKNSAKFDVEESTLNQELQQLGLPQENADSITKVYRNHKERLKGKFKSDIFTMPSIQSIDYKISYILANEISDYKVSTAQSDDINDDLMLKENFKIDNLEAKVGLCLNTVGGGGTHFSTTKDVLGKLINDLEKGYQQITKFKE